MSNSTPGIRLIPLRLALCVVFVLFASESIFAQSGSVEITGELKKWHPITLTLEGPSSSETADPNPFLDYRFNVTFSKGGKSYLIPGYFAADGNAANTSATSGNKWRARFVPDETGTWNYSISFRKGDSVAVDNSPTAGQSTEFDGKTGSFNVSNSDKSGKDFRGRGILRQVGEHYLLFDSGEWFITSGTGSPETFLGYAGFDNTFSQGSLQPRTYSSHVSDWNAGDPTWKSVEGKGIIGAINYLSSVGVNGMFMLVMNTNGDGKDTFPWIEHEDFHHFDVSKLAQWEIVFDHMNRKGIMPQLVLQEMDIEHLLDNGDLGATRKLFYREMMARFNHLNGVTWNIGEEHRLPELGGNTNEQRMDFVNYLTQIDQYDHPVVMHTSAGGNNYDALFGPFLGHPEFGGMSYHIHGDNTASSYTGGGPKTYKYARRWRDNSAGSGHKWIMTLDECCGWNTGVKPDGSNLVPVRRDEMWGMLMAGGSGFNWYLGFEPERRDLTLDDFRRYDFLWKTSSIAADFYRKYLPFVDMDPVDGLTSADTVRVFAKPGEVYAVLLPGGGSTTLDLKNYNETFDVQWYDPRTGGALISGPVAQITGPGIKSLGNPPYDVNKDWVALVRSGDHDIENQLTARFNISAASEPLVLEFDASTSTSTGSTINSYSWDFGDGSSGNGKVTNHTYAAPDFYTVTLTITDALGTEASQTQTVRVKHPSETGAFLEKDGLLVIEVENFERNVPRNGQSWMLDQTLAGFEGFGAMAVLPDAGEFYGSAYSNLSPSLEFSAEFSTSGTYYVWLRVRAHNLDGNSLHIGLDDKPTSSAEAIETNTLNTWVWMRTRKADGGKASLNIGSPGEHTLNMWVREDGIYADRLLLTTDGGYVPSGGGPTESKRTGELPVATISASATSGLAPLNVQFDASDSTTPEGTTLSYSWDFGDGKTGEGVSVEHTYENDGVFDVTLTIEASNGGGDTEQISINVGPVLESHEIHVGSIAIESVDATGSNYAGQARVAIFDEHGLPVAGATVWGRFSGDVSGEASASTDTKGFAVILSNTVGEQPSVVNFCVKSVTHASLAYDSEANTDPEFVCDPGDSVGVENPAALPNNYAINNYPNPFGAITTITMDLPEPGSVTLTVYNTLGQEVVRLLEGHKDAGSYAVRFGTESLSNGMYVVTLECNGRRISKTMLRMR